MNVRPRITTTHTNAELPVSKLAYDEIKSKLVAADYGHCFDGDSIDMGGIALIPDTEEKEPELHPLDYKSLMYGLSLVRRKFSKAQLIGFEVICDNDSHDFNHDFKAQVDLTNNKLDGRVQLAGWTISKAGLLLCPTCSITRTNGASESVHSTR